VSGTGPQSNDGAEFTLAHGGGFAAAVLLIMFSEQTFLNAGPLLLRASEGAAAAGYIFNVLMIARAPLVLFQAVATSLLPHLTRLRSGGGEGEEAFKLSIRGTVAVIGALTIAVGAVVAIAGPALMQIAFGDKFSYDRVDLLIVTVGMGFYLTAATLNQAAIAQGQVRRSAVCFVACAAAFVVWTLLPIVSDQFLRVEIGFSAAAIALCGLLYLLYRSPVARAEDVVRPGSPQELEARLAAADEAS
jgi:O-antigen/teichoic acid export membrane protein